MKQQLDRNRPIPETLIFDLRESHKGYRINKLCDSLINSENRERYKADELNYLSEWDLSEKERELILNRDWAGLSAAGGNIYYLLKLGFVVGHGLYRMGAQMRGETYEEFMQSRNASGAK